ncbi:MAG TPA: radical SAM protein [Haliangium sp.]|nr:radical SAM protein [Haliangium sp.]
MKHGASLVKLEPFALPTAPFKPEEVPPLQVTAEELSRRSAQRTSSYTIYVDLPGNQDEMLLVHGYTGAYDLVSKRVATYLRSLEASHAPKPLYGDWTPEVTDGDDEVIEPSEETLLALKERGYLVALTPEEEEALFVKVSARRHFASLRYVPNYVIMPTYQCNLRCPYCFQDHMRTDPALSHLLRVMDRAMADRILAGMRNIDSAHGITRYDAMPQRITFFGGEPLLAQSRPIVEYLLERLAERGKMQVMAVTNATDLDAYRDLLGPGKISRLQITLDGAPEEHDQRRVYADGSGTFERIAANITMALEQQVHVSIRMNIDRNNIGRLPALADEFQRRGWLGQPNFSPYVAPIHAANDHVEAKTTFNTWQLQRAMRDLAERDPRLSQVGLTDDSLQRQARQIFDEQNDVSPGFRSSFCGANATMYVIDAFADIYACWERTGEPEIRIGHIAETGDVFMNRSIIERWRSRNIVSNPVCRKCRYASSCGGGCPILAEEASGSVFSNYCDGYAKRFRASVAKAYQEHAQGAVHKNGVGSPCEV